MTAADRASSQPPAAAVAGAEAGVVIATRDRHERVLATLDLLADLPEAPPIALVDNGSADGTAAAVAKRHPAVRVIRLADNAGAAARTLGVRALDTPLIAFSDDDSWWAPGALAAATATFAAHPRLGLLAARILVGPERRLDPTCAAMRHSPLSAGDSLPGPAVLGFVACGAIVRRDAFLAVGGFHPRLQIGAEEHLLALDLAAAGWSLAYCDRIVAHHHPGVSGPRPGRLAQQLRNDLWTAWLRRRLPGALRQTAALTLTAIRSDQLAALPAALRGLPWVLRERRPIPASVERSARQLDGVRAGR
jgi:GT2 family glycosyltransferase